MFTALCACFAYKCGVFNLGGEGQFLMGSIAAFLTADSSGLTGFAGILLALLAGTLAGGIWWPHPRRAEDHPRPERDDHLHHAELCGHAVHGRALYQLDSGMRTSLQTPAVSKLVQLPRVISGMRFTWGFAPALVVGLVMYYVLLPDQRRLQAAGGGL